MMHALVYIMSIVATAFVVGALAFGVGRGHPAEAPLPALFETTGGGAVTIGCALWDVPQPDPEDYNGDTHDYVLESDRDSLFLVAVHAGHTVLISGEQCGISLDWRRFPDKERKDGTLRAETAK